MKCPSLRPFLVVLFAFAVPQEGAARTWSNKSGSSFEGDLVGVKDGQVRITRASDGKEFAVALNLLSESDQEFIRKQLGEHEQKGPRAVGLPDAILKRATVYFSFDDPENWAKDHVREKFRAKAIGVEWAKEGVSGGCVSMNGLASKIAIGRPGDFQGSSISISAWINTKSLDSQAVVAWGGAEKGCSLYTKRNEVGWTYRWGRGKDRAEEVVSRKFPVTDGEWHHLCGVFNNSGEMSLWINGELVGNKNRVTLAEKSPTRQAFIGNFFEKQVSTEPDIRAFKGLIDEVIVFNQVLVEREIKILANKR